MAFDRVPGLGIERPPPWQSARALLAAKPLLLPAFIFLLALTPRLAWVLSADVSSVYRPVYDAPSVDYTVPPGIDDVTYYLLTARSIAQGEGYAEPFFGTPSARYPPGWPYVLSSFYFFFGPNPLPAVVFNAVVGAATSVLTYFLGLRLFGRKIGFGAGIIIALFPAHILFSSLLLTEVFFTFVLTSILLLSCSGMGGWRALALGLMMGGATLVRGEAVLLPIVLLAVLRARGASWRSIARQATLVGVGMAVLLVPWAVRNSFQFDSPVLLTTQTGAVLLVGHASNVRGGPDVGPYFDLMEDYRELPEPLRQLEIERAASREAWDGFRSDPLGDLALIPTKLRWFYQHDSTWGPARLFVEAFWTGPLPFQGARIIAEAYYYFVLAGAVLMVAIRHPAAWRGAYGLLFGVIGLWSFMFGFLFYGDARYHMPLLPLLSIAAAGGIVALANPRLASRRSSPSRREGSYVRKSDLGGTYTVNRGRRAGRSGAVHHCDGSGGFWRTLWQ